MIDVGINYLTEIEAPNNRYDEIYKILIKKGYINTIKYPGKVCNYNSLNNVINLAGQTDVKIDIHGLPGIIPSVNSKRFIQNVNWEELNLMISKIQNLKRLSTHMGLENKDRLAQYTIDELKNNYNLNIQTLKHKLQETLNNKIEIGLENIPGGFDFDIETMTPDFISNNWKNADFGVFDISHAKLSAKELGMTYEEYLQKLKYIEKVKILHVSGNIDETNSYINKPDRHVLIHSTEIEDIIKTLKEFNNIDLVISEYAYNTKYTYEKEIIIESIVLNIIVKTRKYELSKKVLEFLEENLKEDVSNIEEILELIESKILKQ